MKSSVYFDAKIFESVSRRVFKKFMENVPQEINVHHEISMHLYFNAGFQILFSWMLWRKPADDVKGLSLTSSVWHNRVRRHVAEAVSNQTPGSSLSLLFREGSVGCYVPALSLSPALPVSFCVLCHWLCSPSRVFSLSLS